MVGSDKLNLHNAGVYQYKGQFRDRIGMIHQVQLLGEKVHIFAPLHAKISVIGTYCIDEVDVNDPTQSVDALKFIKLLQDNVIPYLRFKSRTNEFNTCWWQQDGE